MPVVADAPGHYPLAALGRRTPIVLSQEHKSSSDLSYVIPPAARGKLDYKVRLAAHVRLAPDSGVGFALVNLFTDGQASASIELSTTRVRGRLRTTYTAVALNESTRGTVRGGAVRVDFSNYVLLPSARPGRHTLRFGIETHGRFRVTQVKVEPKSGLIATRQPAQALRVALTVPTDARKGEATKLTVRTTNSGVKSASKVRPELLLPPELGAGGERVLLPARGLRPGGHREDVVSLLPRQAGSYPVQARVQSDVGEALVNGEVVVRSAPAEMTGAVTKDGKSVSTGGGRAPSALILVLIAAALTLLAAGSRIAGRRQRFVQRD